MGFEVTQTEENSLVSVMQNHEIGDLIKPMIREIHLFDAYVAGTYYLKDKSVLKTIKVGDSLTLQRESTNAYDEYAILVLTQEKKKLGYVPRKDNLVFARLMDAGKILKAKITDINEMSGSTRIDVGIYLVDL